MESRILNSEQYITLRVDNQIEWYSRKSSTNKSWFFILKTLELVLALALPLLANFIDTKALNWSNIVSFLGLIIAANAGLLTIFKFQENWIKYRSTSESLKHEKFLFLAGSEPYNDNQSYTKLVKRIETLISQENSNWVSQYNEHIQNGEGS